MIRSLGPLLVAMFLAGCVTTQEASTVPVGRMSGITRLVWNQADGFIYEPDEKNPLRYMREGMPTIVPGRMYTDGGSVPRVFWSIRGLSPWAYGPAYVLHDWLYNEHRCHRLASPPAGYDFDGANAVLSDAINIIIRAGKADGAAKSLVIAAVDKFGRSAWNDVKCNPKPPEPGLALRKAEEITIATFSF